MWKVKTQLYYMWITKTLQKDYDGANTSFKQEAAAVALRAEGLL